MWSVDPYILRTNGPQSHHLMMGIISCEYQAPSDEPMMPAFACVEFTRYRRTEGVTAFKFLRLSFNCTSHEPCTQDRGATEALGFESCPAGFQDQLHLEVHLLAPSLFGLNRCRTMADCLW